jgi:formate hydrogenlyase transcriptional activator
MDKEQHGAAYQLLEQNRKGIRESFDLRLRHRSGREIWVRVSSAPAFDAAGNVTSLFAMISDITDLVQSEQALKRAYSEIKKLKDQLTAEADYLRLEIAETKRYGDLIGRSKPFLEVLKKVEQVAATDTSVVITGETGTGKELIARKIHGLSRRRSHTMICVNCASLPVYLVENELFGRERGAYTGALTAHAGRFEVANGSTLFLDEVGELPLDLQAKLLRVLQEGEFERLGSTKTVRVDVRVIVASNRDLAELVAEGKIRQDLFYRLNVYPIHLPPLRERTEDIPLFVKAFVAEFTRRTGKSIHRIPESTMEALISYYWPGNVRELRNVIEHAVIASERGVLLVDLGAVHTPGSHRDLTLQEVEAAHIQTILERSGWRIKGRAGAARTLGLEPSTLYSKMRKLGITNRTRRGEKQSHG